MTRHKAPPDSRHIHEARFIPGQPGVIPPPPPADEPPPRRGGQKKDETTEGAGKAPSVREEKG